MFWRDFESVHFDPRGSGADHFFKYVFETESKKTAGSGYVREAAKTDIF